MKSQEVLEQIFRSYMLVSVLSDKNGATIYRVRNIETQQDMIVRKYQNSVPAYDKLVTIRHKHLPEIYETFLCQDGQIVLEEFIDGLSVSQVLEGGRYSYRGASVVIRGVCKAVYTLHSFGVVHRDIKPENILISRDGTVKLIDLNASRIVKSHNTQADTVILGTIGYASPEQFGVSQSDQRADIYALGVLLNVMLTGEHPSRRIVKGKAGRIVRKCTLIDPNSRYPNVKKLMQAL